MIISISIIIIIIIIITVIIVIIIITTVAIVVHRLYYKEMSLLCHVLHPEQNVSEQIRRHVYPDGDYGRE